LSAIGLTETMAPMGMVIKWIAHTSLTVALLENIEVKTEQENKSNGIFN
tara:strand:+ start:2290 stop:2436 length:147 start_codon:yes stop_codon:yes gene_type:complete